MQPSSVGGRSAAGQVGIAAPSSLPEVIGPPTGIVRARAPDLLYEGAKRSQDVLLSILLMLAVLPVVALAGLAIVLTTRQSPLLVQRWTGHLGREFPMLKLRTMRPGSGDEAGLPPVLGEVFVVKTPDDARVTAVGRVLRRTSIDELPQLLNVLASQMSLVGPRPALPAEVARYPHSWRRRLAVKPGLTGLWQVSGRSDVPPSRRIAIDRLYIARRTLLLDALILLRTLAATISMRGAW